MLPGEVVINNLLCFLGSASGDFANESLRDVLEAFYSLEEIKEAKCVLANLLKCEIIERKQPNKKEKEMTDLMDLYPQLGSSEIRVRFVASSYKRMPPVGMEFIAPVLISLSEEIAKINAILPKICDIKTEVVNTADTVRQMNIDLKRINDNFSNAVLGMEEAAGAIATEDKELLDGLERLRRVSISEDAIVIPPEIILECKQPVLYSDVVNKKTVMPRNDTREANKKIKKDGELIGTKKNRTQDKTRLIDGVTSPHRCARPYIPQSSNSINLNENYNTANSIVNNNSTKPDETETLFCNDNMAKSENDTTPWTTVDSRRNRKRNSKPLIDYYNRHQRNSERVFGSGNELGNFKAVQPTAQIYIGKVIKNVTVVEIGDYIKNTFNKRVIKLEKLDILSDDYNAFRLIVNLDDKEVFFNHELWPKNVVLDRYRIRRKFNNINQQKWS